MKSSSKQPETDFVANDDGELCEEEYEASRVQGCILLVQSVTALCATVLGNCILNYLDLVVSLLD